VRGSSPCQVPVIDLAQGVLKIRAINVRSACLIVLAIVGACAAAASASAADCAHLPASTLRIHDIRLPVPEVFRVPADTLDRILPEDQLGSRHTLMFTTANVVTVTEIRHRIVPQTDGSVCDAPSLVRIGVGAGRRAAYLERDAAADECVRQEMLAHEEAHNRSFNETVDRFIEQRATEFRQGMVALKQMPTPSAQVAKTRWEAGLHAMIVEAMPQLLRQIRAADARIDDVPTLTALSQSCGGKIRQLQEESNGL
jgi:hypothetical protein